MNKVELNKKLIDVEEMIKQQDDHSTAYYNGFVEYYKSLDKAVVDAMRRLLDDNRIIIECNTSLYRCNQIDYVFKVHADDGGIKMRVYTTGHYTFDDSGVRHTKDATWDECLNRHIAYAEMKIAVFKKFLGGYLQHTEFAEFIAGIKQYPDMEPLPDVPNIAELRAEKSELTKRIKLMDLNLSVGSTVNCSDTRYFYDVKVKAVSDKSVTVVADGQPAKRYTHEQAVACLHKR